MKKRCWVLHTCDGSKKVKLSIAFANETGKKPKSTDDLIKAHKVRASYIFESQEEIEGFIKDLRKFSKKAFKEG